LGYVEKLELRIPPWHLPITELRWGRFLTETDAMVWIDWKGSSPLSLLFINGSEAVNCSITDTKILGADDASLLELSEGRILRNGPLLTTALSSIPGIGIVFPERILRANECKWKSRGRMTCNGNAMTTGWAIHELVTFR
jgi:hypothetical protein